MNKPINIISNELWNKFEEFTDEEIIKGCGTSVIVEIDGIKWFAEVPHTESKHLNMNATYNEVIDHLENLIKEAAENATILK